MNNPTYTFSYTTNDCEDCSVKITFTPASLTHHEITEYFGRFLRACGFYIKSLDEPDINDLAEE